MVATKMNRFTLLELDQVSFRCVHCGFVASVSLDSPRFGLSRCPVCNAEIGPIVEDIFTHLQQARLDVKAAMSEVSVEFELEDQS